MKGLFDCQNLKNSLISGYHNLANARYYLNEINVFPIPDGDTGTNLYLTLKSGINNIKNQKINLISDLLRLFVRGLLMGARGNSGVIFSQIFRGFMKPIPSSLQTLDNTMLVSCFQAARHEAYESVMKPTEGTMLTIIRAISIETKKMKVANALTTSNFFERIILISKKTVLKTQNLLSEAKKNNCVDAGALGLCVFLEGMEHYLKNQIIISKSNANSFKKSNLPPRPVKTHFLGYCTELIIQLHDRYQVKFSLPTVRKMLTAQKVDSIVTGLSTDLFKIHGHTLRPGLMINFLQSYGEFKEVKVENMTLQYQNMMKNHASFNDVVPTYRHSSGILLVVPNDQLKVFFQNEFKINNLIVTNQLTAVQLKSKLTALQTKKVFILSQASQDAEIVQSVAEQNHHFHLELLPTIGPAEQFLSLVYYFPGDKLKTNIDRMHKRWKKRTVITVQKAPTDSGKYLCYLNWTPLTTWTAETDLMKLVTALFKDHIVPGKCEIVTLFYNYEVQSGFIKWVRVFLEDEFEVEVLTVNAGKVGDMLAVCVE